MSDNAAKPGSRPEPPESKTAQPRRGFQAFIEQNPLWWVLAAVGAVLLVSFADLANAKGEQHNIVALELIGRAGGAKSLGLVGITGALWWDLFFIAGYVLLLATLVIRMGRYYRLFLMRTQVRTIMLAAALAAGAADLLENTMLAAGVQSGYDDDAWFLLGATFAWAKWIILVVVIGYVLGAISSHLTTPEPLRKLLLKESAQPEGLSINPEVRHDLGIALSGGGIRSASISLGALQMLERTEAPGSPMGWQQANEITAISGGSNMAGAWSISRSLRTDGSLGRADAWASMSDDDPPSPEESHLLQNLGYLSARTPRGNQTDLKTATSVGDDGDLPPVAPTYRPTAYATILTGFAGNALVLMLMLWIATRPLGWLYRWLASLPRENCRPLPRDSAFVCLMGTPELVFPAVFCLVAGLVGVALWVLIGKLPGNLTVALILIQGLAYGLLAIGGILLAALVAFPAMMEYAGKLGSDRASLTTLAGTLGSLGAVVRILRKPAAKFAPVIGGVVFFVLIAFLAAYWTHGAATTRAGDLENPGSPGSILWWAIVCVLLLAIWALTSPEWWSLASFYRGKLRLAYATYRPNASAAWPYENDSDRTPEGLPEPGFHEYATRTADDRGTPLTVCATNTVSTRAIKTHYGIPAMSVTFTPDVVTMFVPQDDRGRWGKYEAPTTAMENVRPRKLAPRLTTMLAVAISSAAVAPAMGRFRIGPTSLLLTFANIRLGVWMPNPRYVEQLDAEQTTADSPGLVRFPQIRLGYLLKEFLGIFDPSDLFVYLTDGGHWENTGLVELLRKGVYREIVCIDADQGPGDAVKSISEAIDLAALECAVELHLNLDPLRAELKGTRAPDYAPRSVNIGFFEQKANAGPFEPKRDRIGVLWYAKPALTTEMPSTLLAHRETHSDFPRISTLNQFFDTSTFLAYRDLGRYNAQVIRESREILVAAMTGMTGFDDFVDAEYTSWVCTEVISVVSRASNISGERNEYYLGIRAALGVTD